MQPGDGIDLLFAESVSSLIQELPFFPPPLFFFSVFFFFIQVNVFPPVRKSSQDEAPLDIKVSLQMQSCLSQPLSDCSERYRTGEMPPAPPKK